MSQIKMINNNNDNNNNDNNNNDNNKILFNFKNSCCNLKIRGLGAKLCVAFLYNNHKLKVKL